MALALVLLLLAVAMIFLEIMIPSAGLLSVAAVLCAIGWIVAAFVYGGATMGAVAMMVTALLCPIIFVVAARYWPNTFMGRAILIGKAAHHDRTSSAWSQQRAKLVGRTGRTVSPMRPSGAIEVDGRQYDAITDGMPLAANVHIIVTAVEGNSLVVATVDLPSRPVGPAAADDLNRQIPDPFEEPLA